MFGSRPNGKTKFTAREASDADDEALRAGSLCCSRGKRNRLGFSTQSDHLASMALPCRHSDGFALERVYRKPRREYAALNWCHAASWQTKDAGMKNEFPDLELTQNRQIVTAIFAKMSSLGQLFDLPWLR
jgi:hypothetical protein